MPILTKKVEVIPIGKSIQYYKDKGYDVKHKQLLTVKVEDLPKYSDVQVEVLCDFCCKNTMMVKYGQYNRVIEKTGSYVCKKCSRNKANQTNIQKYGTPYPIQLEAFQEKRKQTNLERFGVENYTQTAKCHEKMEQTCLNRYGVRSYAQTEECHKKMEQTTQEKYGVPHYSQTQDYKERFHKTCVDRYGESYKQQFIKKAFESFSEKTGYDNPLKSPEIREQIKQTCVDRYGYEYNLQVPEVREKITQTLYTNSSQKVSKQQRYICNLYQGVLNFPVKYYNADIYLQNDNLIVEYDGGGHMLNVITGRETVEEYTRKEIIRFNVIKHEGYKQMKIISKTDHLPDDQILLRMLKEAKQYFNTTAHNWINFDIDNSKMINAENKNSNGISYHFGELHAIK